MPTKTKTKTKTGRPAKHPFKPEYVFRIYELEKSELPDSKIADAIGIPFDTYRYWVKNNAAVKMAIKAARVAKKFEMDKEAEMESYIAGRLSPHLRTYWEQIKNARKERNYTALASFRLKAHENQLLFLHTWYKANFNVSRTLQYLGIPRSTYISWRGIPRFKAIMDEMMEIKKDFYEDALVNCVRRGETQAIIFANKSLNRDRGYSDKKEVEVSGNVKHEHEHKMLIDLDRLDLPLEVQVAIAEAMEKRKRLDDDIASRNVETDNQIRYDVNGREIPVTDLITVN